MIQPQAKVDQRLVIQFRHNAQGIIKGLEMTHSQENNVLTKLLTVCTTYGSITVLNA